MSEFKNKFSIPPRKDRQSDENVFDFSSSRQAYPPKKVNDTALSYSWHAVSNQENVSQDEAIEKPKVKPQSQEVKTSAPERQSVTHAQKSEKLRPSQISMAEIAVDKKMFKIPEGVKAGSGKEYAGQVLAEQNFSKTDLTNANFSAADLTGADFSGAVLRGADLSGANMTDADLSQADLSGAILAGANLLRANFTGAKLNGVTLTEANLEEAILLGVEIDELGIEELQALVEYLAKYYPHKLNFKLLNLTLLNLAKIDLKNVDLSGADFTGVDFTGVSLVGVDLSQTNITPQQIAQALGRVPTPQELKQIMAPKKKKGKEFQGIDFTDLFLGNKEIGIWDTTKAKALDIGKILEAGKKVFRKSAQKPPVKDSEALEYIKAEKEKEAKGHNAELRKIIEARKRQELEARRAKKQEFQQEVARENAPQEKEAEKSERKISRENIERIRSMRERSRD